MLQIQNIVEDLYKNQDFSNSLKLMQFFEGELIQSPFHVPHKDIPKGPYKHRLLDCEDDFRSILVRNIGDEFGWNASIFLVIKEKLEMWLKSLEACRGVSFNNEMVVKYINLTGRFINYLDSIDFKKVGITDSGETNRNSSFDDLYKREEDKAKDGMYMNILREAEPPLINTEGEWIGNKQAARVFYHQLEFHGVVRPNIPIKVVAVFFEKRFGIDKSNIEKVPGPIAELYEEYLSKEIKRVKMAKIDQLP